MAHPVDVYVGQRVRQRRLLLGMTMRQLGNSVGIKFQQIQRYETGTDRISASRMWDIATAMKVPVSLFFKGLDDAAPDMGTVPGDPFNDEKARDLVRTYYGIPKNQRRHIFDLIHLLGEAA